MPTLAEPAVRALVLREQVITDRLAWLVLAITDLSDGQYLCISRSQDHKVGVRGSVQPVWKVAVKWHGGLFYSEATFAESSDRGGALVLALDRAVTGLRRLTAKERLS